MSNLEVTQLGKFFVDIGLGLTTLAIYEGSINIWYIWNRYKKAKTSPFWRMMVFSSIAQVTGLLPMLVYCFIHNSLHFKVMKLTSYGPWILFNGYIVYLIARIDQLMVVKQALNPNFISGSRWKRIIISIIIFLGVVSNFCFITAALDLSIANPLFSLNNAIVAIMHIMNIVACIQYYTSISSFHAKKMGQKESHTTNRTSEKILLLLPIILEILNMVALPLAIVTSGQVVLGMFTSICTPTLDMAIMVRYLMVYTLSVLRNDDGGGVKEKAGDKAISKTDNNVHEYQKPSLSQFDKVTEF